jgi:hypothetical protein
VSSYDVKSKKEKDYFYELNSPADLCNRGTLCFLSGSN